MRPAFLTIIAFIAAMICYDGFRAGSFSLYQLAFLLFVLTPALVINLFLFLDKNPRVIIDRHGIEDSRSYDRPIPWEDIRELRMAHSRGDPTFIIIETDHPEMYLRDTPTAGSINTKRESWMGSSKLTLDVGGLNATIDRVAAHIRRVSGKEVKGA